jgi:hypothetical protein
MREVSFPAIRLEWLTERLYVCKRRHRTLSHINIIISQDSTKRLRVRLEDCICHIPDTHYNKYPVGIERRVLRTLSWLILPFWCVRGRFLTQNPPKDELRRVWENG